MHCLRIIMFLSCYRTCFFPVTKPRCSTQTGGAPTRAGISTRVTSARLDVAELEVIAKGLFLKEQVKSTQQVLSTCFQTAS